MVRCLAHTLVVPWRLGIVLLISEDQPLRSRGDYRFEFQVRIAAYLLRQGAVQSVGDIDFLLFEHGETRRGLGDAFHHQTLDVWGLAPIVRVRFQDQFYTG